MKPRVQYTGPSLGWMPTVETYDHHRSGPHWEFIIDVCVRLDRLNRSSA